MIHALYKPNTETVEMENVFENLYSCHNIQDMMPQHKITSYIRVPPMQQYKFTEYILNGKKSK